VVNGTEYLHVDGGGGLRSHASGVKISRDPGPQREFLVAMRQSILREREPICRKKLHFFTGGQTHRIWAAKLCSFRDLATPSL
jgi:hypothetical protein